MELAPEGLAAMATQFGLMQKISTGNSFIDILLCLLVPLLLRNLVPKCQEWATLLMQRKKVDAKVFQRVIKHTQQSSYYWYDSDNQPPNSILQRAILNFINKQVDNLSKLPKADLQLKKRAVNPDASKADSGDNNVNTNDSEDGNSNASNEHAYEFNVAPPDGQWVTLSDGLKFMRQQEALDDKSKNIKCSYILESDAKDGNERIERFVEEALDTFKAQQTAKVDPSRYLYMPVLNGFRAPAAEEGSASTPSAMYKRYKLSEDKSFASFFHPEKPVILNLVDQFLGKRGKFAIPGYPQKLGFLLYGPPGTGKTSFIKALAQHTRRSIISIPLSKISTNQELMDIVFDNRITIQNASDASIQLPYSKTIFVMEDVDAASSVVQRRAGASAAPAAPSAAQVMALAEQIADAKLAANKAAMARAAGGSGEGSRDGDETDQDKDDGDEPAASSSARVRRAASGRGSNAALRSSAADCEAGTSTGPIGPSLPGFGNFGKNLFKGDDELNLAGLLNVLDGVVDTPGRIVIMTTNHPEKLDPALIRPGRINKKVYMGRMSAEQALSMMGHYFGKAQADACAGLVQGVFVDDVLSPADLEAMCAEFDTVPQLVEALGERFQLGNLGEAFKPC